VGLSNRQARCTPTEALSPPPAAPPFPLPADAPATPFCKHGTISLTCGMNCGIFV
jgi:hypothetical protein